jgi:hypothetical protein
MAQTIVVVISLLMKIRRIVNPLLLIVRRILLLGNALQGVCRVKYVVLCLGNVFQDLRSAIKIWIVIQVNKQTRFQIQTVQTNTHAVAMCKTMAPLASHVQKIRNAMV